MKLLILLRWQSFHDRHCCMSQCPPDGAQSCSDILVEAAAMRCLQHLQIPKNGCHFTNCFHLTNVSRWEQCHRLRRSLDRTRRLVETMLLNDGGSLQGDCWHLICGCRRFAVLEEPLDISGGGDSLSRAEEAKAAAALHRPSPHFPFRSA